MIHDNQSCANDALSGRFRGAASLLLTSPEAPIVWKNPSVRYSSHSAKAWIFLVLVALVPRGPVQGQQVPETRNSKAALASAPILILSEELRFVPEMGGDTAAPPAAYGLKVNGEGWVFLMDAPQAIFRPGASSDRVPQVWVFDSEGRFRGTIGQGGEMLRPLALAVARDSVIVSDFSPPRGGMAPGNRLHVFTVDGRLLATHDYAHGPPRSLNFNSPAFQGTARGWVAEGRLRVETPFGERSGPHYDSTLVMSFLPAAGEVRRILSYPTAPRYQSDDLWSSSPVLSSHPRHAVAGDGRIYLHSGAKHVIEVRSHDGTLEKRIVGEVDPITVTDEDFEKGIRRVVRESRDAFEESNRESELNTMLAAIEKNARWAGKADYRPVLGSMWASRDGSILVERLDLAPDPFADTGRKRWDVLGPAGRVAGQLETPAGLTVRAFDWPHIYTTRLVDGQLEAVRFRVTPR